MNNPPAHAVAMAEQQCCLLETPSRHRLPDPGAADALTISDHGFHGSDLVAPLRPNLPQQIQVTAAAAAEAEVFSDEHVANPEALAEQLAGKGLRLYGRQALIETQTKHRFSTRSSELTKLLAQAGQSRRGPLRNETLKRMRLEGDHHGPAATLYRLIAQPINHRTVPTVDPIEVTDGNRRTAMAPADVVQSPDELHRPHKK